LLPVRHRPFVGEQLSSWLVRLAHGLGLSGLAFAKEVLGVDHLSRLGVIDAFEIPNFLEKIALLSGLPKLLLRELSFYDVRWFAPGIAYNEGALEFALLDYSYREKERVGLRLNGAFFPCIECWREDPTPYIRKSWRQISTTVCEKHYTPLVPSCRRCEASFNASFSSLSRGARFQLELSVCRSCGADSCDLASYSWDDVKKCDPEFHDCLFKWSNEETILNQVAAEEIYRRSFERGWFSLPDATRLQAVQNKLIRGLELGRRKRQTFPFIGFCPYWDYEYEGLYEARVQRWIDQECNRASFESV